MSFLLIHVDSNFSFNRCPCWNLSMVSSSYLRKIASDCVTSTNHNCRNYTWAVQRTTLHDISLLSCLSQAARQPGCYASYRIRLMQGSRQCGLLMLINLSIAWQKLKTWGSWSYQTQFPFRRYHVMLAVAR